MASSAADGKPPRRPRAANRTGQPRSEPRPTRRCSDRIESPLRGDPALAASVRSPGRVAPARRGQGMDDPMATSPLRSVVRLFRRVAGARPADAAGGDTAAASPESPAVAAASSSGGGPLSPLMASDFDDDGNSTASSDGSESAAEDAERSDSDHVSSVSFADARDDEDTDDAMDETTSHDAESGDGTPVAAHDHVDRRDEASFGSNDTLDEDDVAARGGRPASRPTDTWTRFNAVRGRGPPPVDCAHVPPCLTRPRVRGDSGLGRMSSAGTSRRPSWSARRWTFRASPGARSAGCGTPIAASGASSSRRR